MSEDQEQLSQVKLKQRVGQKYGEWRDEVLLRIVSEEDTIPLEEWYGLVDKMMSRPEVIEAFLAVLDFCKDHPDRVLPPGQSRVFRRKFVTYASVDNKDLLLNKLKDSILYMETTTAHRRPARRKISSLEDAF